MSALPKGTLVLIGGSEDRGPEVNRPAIYDYLAEYREQEILRYLIAQTGLRTPRIAVVVSASEIPREMGQMYFTAFRHLQVPQAYVDVLDIRDPETANLDVAQEWLRAANIVLFSGGDQRRLAEVLAGTRFVDTLRERYQHEPLIVAGTSAGSMALPTTILWRGTQTEAMLSGDVCLGDGLGLLDGCIVDTHFISRGRFSRLAQAVVSSPAHLGIGLSEDTALVIRHGIEAECLGSGMAVVIDGNHIGASNAARVPEGVPLYVEGLRVHCLIRGNRFDLATRQFFAV